MKPISLLAILLSLVSAGALSARGFVLVEAESFSQRGGWVVDPQFMDQMGSPYLLAHGLGRPVADATTEIEFPATGSYRVWVRTKDWVAKWKAPGTPGRFELLVNGQPLKTVFGTEGAQWHWQDGGNINITGRKVRLALRDLTGFEGRCDAILFARDAKFAPPNRDTEMTAFRRSCLGLDERPEPAGEYDFVVTGGGIAGTCAALSAARLGLKVAFIQDRPVLGGNNSSEVRVWLQGARNKEPWPRVGDIVAELEQQKSAHYGPDNTAELYEDEKKLALVRAEPNIRLFLEHRANKVETDDGKMRAVIAQEINTGRRVRIGGRWFADCTGDGAVGALAGADFDVHPKGRMGPCNLWNVIETETPQLFPRCPWALDLSDKPFPGRSATKPNTNQLGGWYWESGFDRDPFLELEYVRDWNFRAMYGAWDAMKNVDKVLPNHRLNWSAHILGKRESRRLMGDVVLTLDDLKEGRKFPDGCVPTGWKVDLHLPDPKFEKGFEGDAFISKAHFTGYPMPFWIPYRCLYSRNIKNLFMAGRDISVTHEALGAVRVMRTGGCMGEIVGMAASLCKKHNAAPRSIYEEHLTELQDLMRRGVGKQHAADASTPTVPALLTQAGTNLARLAKISVPNGNLLNDGKANVTDNSSRWLGTGQLPHIIEFAWESPVTIRAARIISGYFTRKVADPIADFVLQWHDGAEWKDIPGASAQDNLDPCWHRAFSPVTTSRIRLVITKTKINVSRIWEVEFYGTPNAVGSQSSRSASGTDATTPIVAAAVPAAPAANNTCSRRLYACVSHATMGNLEQPKGN
ncbi:MAG: FAD-dependent oxidoreductase [Verrucomicrobia bacterium]|nr:FAD-dependent oxidoreductase [Verrucomicrobiota bacterium]